MKLKIDSGIFTASEIVLTVLRLIFFFHFFLLCFYRILYTAIVFHCKFITRDVYWNFKSDFRYSILSQFHLNCILKALCWRFYPKIQTCLHYLIFRKVPDTISIITYDTARYQEIIQYDQKLVAHLLSKESCMFFYLLLAHLISK